MANKILGRAANVILANGFARGEYVTGESQGRAAARCPVCPRAAIAIAADRHPLFAVAWPDHCDLLGDEHAVAEDRMALAEIITAETAFARYLREELEYVDGPDDQTLIELWTDEPGRTQPEVVGALRAAAEYGGRYA